MPTSLRTSAHFGLKTPAEGTTDASSGFADVYDSAEKSAKNVTYGAAPVRIAALLVLVSLASLTVVLNFAWQAHETFTGKHEVLLGFITQVEKEPFGFFADSPKLAWSVPSPEAGPSLSPGALVSPGEIVQSANDYDNSSESNPEAEAKPSTVPVVNVNEIARNTQRADTERQAVVQLPGSGKVFSEALKANDFAGLAADQLNMQRNSDAVGATSITEMAHQSESTVGESGRNPNPKKVRWKLGDQLKDFVPDKKERSNMVLFVVDEHQCE